MGMRQGARAPSASFRCFEFLNHDRETRFNFDPFVFPNVLVIRICGLGELSVVVFSHFAVHSEVSPEGLVAMSLK